MNGIYFFEQLFGEYEADVFVNYDNEEIKMCELAKKFNDDMEYLEDMFVYFGNSIEDARHKAYKGVEKIYRKHILGGRNNES